MKTTPFQLQLSTTGKNFILLFHNSKTAKIQNNSYRNQRRKKSNSKKNQKFKKLKINLKFLPKKLNKLNKMLMKKKLNQSNKTLWQKKLLK